MFRFFLIFVPFIFSLNASNLDSEFFFDASNISIHPKKGTQEFKGNVLFVGGKTIISADSLIFNSTEKTLVASGNVILIVGDQIFLGSEINLAQQTGFFSFKDAVLINKDSSKIQNTIHELLGFSSKDFLFEDHQLKKIKEIEAQKSELAIKYYNIRRYNDQNTEIDEIIRSYERLLLKQDLIANQPNPKFYNLNEKYIQSLQKRRIFWEQYSSQRPSFTSSTTDYYRLSGDSITKITERDYLTKKANFSPCFCNDDENPDWSFEADEILATQGGYATLKNAFFKIKSIPIIYIPYFKIPIKSKRQSGFLLPSYQWNRTSGSVISQPLYLAISENKDATITTNYYAKRGLGLETEFRLRNSEFSGLNFNIKALRDDVWKSELENRDLLSKLYKNGLENIQNNNQSTTAANSSIQSTIDTLSSSDYWNNVGLANCISNDVTLRQVCLDSLDQHQTNSLSAWRGAISWNGLHFFDQNWKFITQGDWFSDHRFEQDLYINNDYAKSILGQENARTYSRIGNELNFHTNNWHISGYSLFGDFVNINRSFSGYHLPAILKINSNYIPLITSKNLPLGIYGRLSLTHRQIGKTDNDAFNTQETLGKGNWNQVHSEFLIPILVSGAVQLNSSIDFESRIINSELFDNKSSRINSWKFKIDSNLPLDGTLGHIEYLSPFFHHYMNWNIGFSYRPTVRRSGLYTSSEDFNATGGTGLSYFTSDLNNYSSRVENAVNEEDVMKPHQRIIFSTDHIFRQYQKSFTAEAEINSSLKDNREFREQAKEELETFFVNNNLKNNQPDDLLKKSIINKLISTPLLFDAKIEYDFKDAQKRKEQRNIGFSSLKLVEPLKDLETNTSVSIFNFQLAAKHKFNFYSDSFNNEQYILWSPVYFGSKIGLRHQTEKGALFYDFEENVIQNKVRTESISFNSDLFKNLSTGIVLGRRFITSTTENRLYQYQTQYILHYLPSSDCWAMRFVRTKPFDRDERNANYLLELQVKFGDITRSLPDISRPLIKHLHKRNQEAL